MTKSKKVVMVDTKQVFCEGNSNLKMGHPRVFLRMDAQNQVLCPYCATQFVLRVKKDYADT